METKGSPVILVIGTSARSGKSTAASFFAERLGTRSIGTSHVIGELVEEQFGLAPGQVLRDRALNSETWRPELIATGDDMAARGFPAGVIAVQRGYRVVEGIRRAGELEQTVERVRELFGVSPLIVCVELLGGQPPSDNTETEALRAMADVVVVNPFAINAPQHWDDQLAEFHDRLAAVLPSDASRLAA